MIYLIAFDLWCAVRFLPWRWLDVLTCARWIITKNRLSSNLTIRPLQSLVLLRYEKKGYHVYFEKGDEQCRMWQSCSSFNRLLDGMLFADRSGGKDIVSFLWWYTVCFFHDEKPHAFWTARSSEQRCFGQQILCESKEEFGVHGDYDQVVVLGFQELEFRLESGSGSTRQM